MDLVESIMSLYKEPAYQHLNAYYQQKTVFNVLGIERNENRHSAFIAWLLNPKESHSLNEQPIRRFLSLVGAKSKSSDKKDDLNSIVCTHLITGNYRIKSSYIKTEQSIAGLIGSQNLQTEESSGKNRNDSQKRFDIWIMLQVEFGDSQDSEELWNIPVVIENKIYSSEGNAANYEIAQTVMYQKAMKIFCEENKQKNNCQPLMVYLTPSGAKSPICKSFVHISYQDLLDHVISPSSVLAHLFNVGNDAISMIKGYIRNLSCPAQNEDKKDYSILAIEESESEHLNKIYAHKAYQNALYAAYKNESRPLNVMVCKEEELGLAEDFWNANEELFKIVLYNQFRSSEVDKEKRSVDKIVRVSKRDNTRYWVITKDGTLMNPDKPASKSESSYLIFKAYCLSCNNETITLNQLRKVFPGEINQYYSTKYFQHLFYKIDENLHFDVKSSKYYLMDGGINTWDFYPDENHRLPNVESGNIRSVKMWRKADFDQLISKAKELGIKVTPAD